MGGQKAMHRMSSWGGGGLRLRVRVRVRVRVRLRVRVRVRVRVGKALLVALEATWGELGAAGGGAAPAGLLMRVGMQHELARPSHRRKVLEGPLVDVQHACEGVGCRVL